MNEICKDCGGPIHWSGHADSWYHDNATDSLNCPSVTIEPVETVA